MPVLSHPSVLLARHLISRIREGKRTLLIFPRGAEPGDQPPYPVGARIAVRGAVGQARPSCTIAVTRLTDQAVDELDDRDAQALGFSDLSSFRSDWTEHHGDDLAARAWVLRVTLSAERDGPVFLRRKAGTTWNPHLAIPGAGEVLDEHVTAGYGRAAQRTEEDRVEQLLEHRKTLKPYERLAMVLGEAGARGIDLSRELFVVEQRLASMEQRVHRVTDRTASEEAPQG